MRLKSRPAGVFFSQGGLGACTLYRASTRSLRHCQFPRRKHSTRTTRDSSPPPCTDSLQPHLGRGRKAPAEARRIDAFPLRPKGRKSPVKNIRALMSVDSLEASIGPPRKPAPPRVFIVFTPSAEDEGERSTFSLMDGHITVDNGDKILAFMLCGRLQSLLKH